MRHLHLGALAGALLLCVLGGVATAAEPTHAVKVPRAKHLHLSIPEGFSVEARDTLPDTVEVRIGPPDGSWELGISVMPREPFDNDSLERSVLSMVVMSWIKTMADRAEEGGAPIREFQGAAGIGYFARLTDRRPELPEGEFRYVTFVALGVKRVMLSITLLADEVGGESVVRALDIVRSATYDKAPRAPQVEIQPRPVLTARHQVRLGERGWVLQADLSGFELETQLVQSDGSGSRFQASHPHTGLTVSVHLQQEWTTLSNEECRDYYFTKIRNSPVEMEEVRLIETSVLAVAEYMLKRDGEKRIDQKHVHAYVGAPGGVCTDVHISKARYKSDRDADHFSAILKSIRIVEDDPGAAEAGGAGEAIP